MQDPIQLLRRYISGAWRNRWYGVAIAWLICAAGWIGVASMPNIYQSSARLYVDADAVLTPLLQGLALENTPSGQLEVMQRTLLSRPNLETVISKTPLELGIRNADDRERLIAALENDIKVVPQSRNLFTITYRNADPQTAYDVVQTIMNIFIENRSGSNRADMDNARAFLEQQIKSYERQLRAAEMARADFRSKYVDLLPSDATGNSRLDAARSNVTALTGQLADARAKRSMLESELATTPPTIVTETDPAVPGGSGGGGALAAAQRKLQELLLTDTENHPDVQRQREMIQMLKSSGGGGGASSPGRPAQTRSQPNAVYAQLKVQLVDTDATIASLTRQVTDATAERDRLEQIARSMPGLQAQYINMDRDYDTLRKNYNELLGRREQMRLAAAADADADKIKLRIIDPAQVPRIPIAPPRVLLNLGVLAAGIAGGAAAAAFLAQLTRSFQLVEDLQSLGLPVLGGISLLPGALHRSRIVVSTMALLSAVLLLCGVCGGLIYHTLRQAGMA